MTPPEEGRPREEAGVPAWLVPAGVAVLSFAAFLPSLHGKFILFDDDINFLNNQSYRGFGLGNLLWMFSTFQLGGVYQPLSWLSSALDYKLWGMDPTGYHLGNMLIHAASGVLAYLVALRLFPLALGPEDGRDGRASRAFAAFAALAFSVHPLRVEAVAWASNRSYVLPGMFYLLALLAYLQAHAARSGAGRPRPWLKLSLAAFILSLLSKAIGMTFPAALLVLDVWPLRRLRLPDGPPGDGAASPPEPQGPRRASPLDGLRAWAADPAVREVLREKAPFFVAALLAAAISYHGRSSSGEISELFRFGLGQRFAKAGFGFAFYLVKSILPFGLTPIVTLARLPSLLFWPYLWRSALAAGLTVLAFAGAGRRPAGLALWALYALTIFPFLGILQYSTPWQTVSDKWCYLASVYLALAAGAWLLRTFRRLRASGRPGASLWVPSAAALLVCAWAGLSWRQSALWRGTEQLFLRNAALYPACYICRNNLAAFYVGEKRYDEAVAQATLALRLKPDFREAYVNMAAALRARGDMDNIYKQAELSAKQAPSSAKARSDYADALFLQGRVDEAIVQAQEAVRLDPGLFQANYSLAFFLHRRGDIFKAEEYYRAALAIRPDAGPAHLNLGTILAERGKDGEAREHCWAAYKIDVNQQSPACPREPDQ